MHNYIIVTCNFLIFEICVVFSFEGPGSAYKIQSKEHISHLNNTEHDFRQPGK